MWTEQTLVDPYKYYPNVLSIIERDKLVQEFIDLGEVDKQQDKIFNRTNFRLKALSEKFDSKLKELINDDTKLEEMSKMALQDPSTGGNPIVLTQEDFLILYKNSYEGKLSINYE